MAAFRLPVAFAAALLLVAAVSGLESGNGNNPWGMECIQATGNITIGTNDDVYDVPANASECSYCDNDPLLILSWGSDKHLLIFLDVQKDANTFDVVQLQYFEGSKVWSANVKGFRGRVNGEVECQRQTRFDLTYDDDKAQPTDYGCPATPALSNETAAVNTTSEELDAPVDPSARISRRFIRQQRALQDDISSSDKRVINLTTFTIKYSAYGKNVSDSSLYVSSCRAEPDLTLTLAVSGAATAAVLVAAAVVALRLFY